MTDLFQAVPGWIWLVLVTAPMVLILGILVTGGRISIRLNRKSGFWANVFFPGVFKRRKPQEPAE